MAISTEPPTVRRLDELDADEDFATGRSARSVAAAELESTDDDVCSTVVASIPPPEVPPATAASGTAAVPAEVVAARELEVEPAVFVTTDWVVEVWVDVTVTVEAGFASGGVELDRDELTGDEADDAELDADELTGDSEVVLVDGVGVGVVVLTEAGVSVGVVSAPARCPPNDISRAANAASANAAIASRRDRFVRRGRGMALDTNVPFYWYSTSSIGLRPPQRGLYRRFTRKCK